VGQDKTDFVKRGADMAVKMKKSFLTFPITLLLLLSPLVSIAGPQGIGMPDNSNPDGTNTGSIVFDTQRLGNLFGASGEIPPGDAVSLTKGTLSLTVKQQAGAPNTALLLPGDNSTAAGTGLLNILKQSADQNGVQISIGRILPENKMKGLTKVSARIETTSDMESLVRFLAAIKNYPKYLAVDELMITSFRMPTQKKYEIRPGLTIAGYCRSMEEDALSEDAAGNLGIKDKNLEILRELTGVLPADTYLNTYVNRDGNIQLVGVSASASDLISKLEQSPFLAGIVLKAPIRNIGKSPDGKDRNFFNIEAKLKK
jgi:hypothetical protein